MKFKVDVISMCYMFSYGKVCLWCGFEEISAKDGFEILCVQAKSGDHTKLQAIAWLVGFLDSSTGEPQETHVKNAGDRLTLRIQNQKTARGSGD